MHLHHVQATKSVSWTLRDHLNAIVTIYLRVKIAIFFNVRVVSMDDACETLRSISTNVYARTDIMDSIVTISMGIVINKWDLLTFRVPWIDFVIKRNTVIHVNVRLI